MSDYNRFIKRMADVYSEEKQEIQKKKASEENDKKEHDENI